MAPHQVVRQAIGGETKAVREAFRRLGKRVSERWITRQTEPPQDVRFCDFYAKFLLWYEAIWKARPEGAEILFEDLRCRVTELRGNGLMSGEQWGEVLAQCEQDHAAFVAAIFTNADSETIRADLLKAIAMLRHFLVLVEAEEWEIASQRLELARAA